jgi:protein SCO1
MSVLRPRAVPVLIAVALLAISLAAGILLGGLSHPNAAADNVTRAPGLRAGVLPDGLGGKPAPNFTLTDARGGVIDTRALRGKPYAVTFLYTHCPDVCPTLAEDLRGALADMGPGRASVVAVSVDPRGDTPAAVRKFAREHHLPATFHYAIGTRKQLQPVWKDYFSSPEIGDPRSSTHTAAVWLVDAKGRLRGMYPGAAPVASADVAHDLLALR